MSSPSVRTQETAIPQKTISATPDFEQLYSTYWHYVYSICYRLVKNEAITEELVQEAFLRVLRKMHLFQGKSRFTTWLYRVARNTALMYLRDQQHKDSYESLTPEDEDEKQAGRQERLLGRADSNLESVTDRVTLERVISQLAPGYRTAILLHDLHGYEHGEICEMLDVCAGTSKSQLHKGRKKLRSLLNRTPAAPSGRNSHLRKVA